MGISAISYFEYVSLSTSEVATAIGPHSHFSPLHSSGRDMTSNHSRLQKKSTAAASSSLRLAKSGQLHIGNLVIYIHFIKSRQGHLGFWQLRMLPVHVLLRFKWQIKWGNLASNLKRRKRYTSCTDQHWETLIQAAALQQKTKQIPRHYQCSKA